MKITVTRSADVPEGAFCVDYRLLGTERCEQIRMSESRVDWSDGLGSPGTITFYSCALFDVGLRQIWGDKESPGMALEKCDACKSAEGK